MAESLGLALGITSLVLQLYNKCKDSSADFHNLHLDLKSFHQTLLLTEHYLPRLDDSRAACEKLVAEIEKLLSRHASRNPLRRVKLTFEDIQPLRTRLILQMSALHTSVHMLKERDLIPDRPNAIVPTRSCQSRSVAIERLDNIRNDGYQHAAPDLSVEFVQDIVSEDSWTPIPTPAVTSATRSFFTPDESLVSNEQARDQLFMQHLTSSSSISSVQTGRSSTSTHFQWQRGSSRTSISRDAGGDDAAFLCNLWALDSGLTLDNVLINISRTQDELPIHVEQVKLLLQQGASLEYRDPECLRTPLIWAIVAGRTDLVELFLDNQTLIDTRDGIWDWTPVIWAVMEDKLAVLDLLIRTGAKLEAADSRKKRTPLLWAASIGNYYAAGMLLTSDKELINVTDKEGMTPLALAYFEGHVKTARSFLVWGDNPSFRFKSGSSLLAWAILAKDEDFARLLLEYGADPQSTNMNGVPALILTIQQNLPHIAELLAIKGADVQSRDEKNAPALTVAVKGQLFDIAAMLVRKRAALEARDGEGNTALLWAIWRNDERMVEMLIKTNADATAIDAEGVSVQEWAVWTGNEKIVRLVSSAG